MTCSVSIDYTHSCSCLSSSMALFAAITVLCPVLGPQSAYPIDVMKGCVHHPMLHPAPPPLYSLRPPPHSIPLSLALPTIAADAYHDVMCGALYDLCAAPNTHAHTFTEIHTSVCVIHLPERCSHWTRGVHPHCKGTCSFSMLGHLLRFQTLQQR